jgi:hypothetical protein
MLKKIVIVLMASLFIQTTYADALYSILNSSRNIEAIEGNIESVAIGSLQSQWDIEKLMRQVDGHMSGHFGWGNYQTHDYQSYGNSAIDWNSVMRLAAGGGGSGDLGVVMSALANQFPIQQDQFNKAGGSHVQQQYYSLQSQTILATRAASQLDYDKIQSQITYQQMLQNQIEKTNDLKSALDLNNRIQAEANLINLEILREQSLANQQHAMSDQANMNTAFLHAKFLTKSN